MTNDKKVGKIAGFSLLSVAMMLAVILGTASLQPAHADSVKCEPDCYLTGVIWSNIEVKNGATLTVENAEVHGNVEGKKCQQINFIDSIIYGNVEAMKCNVEATNTNFGGNVQVMTGSLSVSSSTIDGNVSVMMGDITLSSSTVTGNLEIKKGDLSIDENSKVEGNVTCKISGNWIIDALAEILGHSEDCY
ncbi:MAG: hypothetical protein P8X91_09500 [Candidatus Bathyarchaeota archaeon]